MIAIVEDDPNIADLVELYLRRDGYRPYQADTGERAVEIIAERQPSLVLLDVGLAGGDGRARGLPSEPRATCDVPIVFMTPSRTTRSTGCWASSSAPTTT